MPTRERLKELQSLSLDDKIALTKIRIVEWINKFGVDGVYVSFSGGKDSTVLLHIVRQMYRDQIPAVFVNTGLEYPEIQKFAMSQSNVVVLRPTMRFDEVIKTYGYPIISKEISQKLHDAHTAKMHGNDNGYAVKQFNGTYVSKNGKANSYGCQKWKFMLNADFNASHMCCNVMKKRPAKKYEKQTGRKPILATMAIESRLRTSAWLTNGCNAFESKRPVSQPMAFWTEQDVLHYIKRFHVPYCSVYGDIVAKHTVDGYDVLNGQLDIIDLSGQYSEGDTLETTGVNRTGCIFCMYGVHLEKEPNKFQRLKETHPVQYKYCIGGGEYVDGVWKPNKDGLCIGHVLDFIGVKYE